MTGVEASNIVTAMIRNQEVWAWNATLTSLDVPDQFMTFAGIICSVLIFVFEDEFVDNAFDTFAPLFDLSDEIYNFIKNVYLPEVKT